MPVALSDGYPIHALGGSCFVCNSSRRDLPGRQEWVVDFERHSEDLEGEACPACAHPLRGTPSAYVFVCETCIVNAGHLLGMLTADEHSTLGAERDSLRERVANLERRLAEAEGVVSVLRRYDRVEA